MTDNTNIHTKGFWSSIYNLATRYQDFLLDPGTLFTVASGVLLIIAIAAYPQNMKTIWNKNKANTPTS